MSETTMPATEAAATNDELGSYELAFHVLPTVAEGEVTTIEDALTSIITEAGGTIGLTETAQRFDLAYELQKMIDGKYRRFTTSYFGWIRFTAEPRVVEEVLHEVEAHESVLRALVVRLTRQEEEHPFYLHEALAARKPVTDIDVDAAIANAPSEPAPEASADESPESAKTTEESTDAPAAETDSDETVESAASEDTKA
ncbi:MAG TPA: 30S ribosomal protein S6 [Candidatus Paceibacterota bacterium]|nr:30S ribosomal protein S6 [Candidatus Paceibacterota bacterium]